MNINLYKLAKRLLKTIFPNSYNMIILNRSFKLITKMIKHNGTAYTVKHLKQMRLHVTRYLCGEPLLVNNIGVGLVDGFPKAFIFLKELIDSGKTEDIKFALSILGISRTLVPKKREIIPINWKTITDPSKTNKEYIIPNGFLKRFCRDFDLLLSKPRADVKTLYVSTKAGPQGPSTLSIIKSILYLNYSQMQWILDLTSKEFHDFFTTLYSWCFNNYNKIPSFTKDENSIKNQPITGRFSIVKDPECKMRIIAITDYITQCTLKPINDSLFKLLNKLPRDRLNQNPIIENKVSNDRFWSLDLTAATDRFPIRLQERLLGFIFQDKAFAASWRNLIANREYMTPEGEQLKYSVGQPMGSYSSWIAFTLSHHLVVQYCAYLEGVYPFDQYILLGDDIVIYNDKVAERYIKVMGKLGVELSLAKTHVSKNTYEFAKRWFKSGIEVTGVPLAGLVNNLLNPTIIYTILYDYFVVKGNLYMYKNDLLTLVCNLYFGYKSSFLFPKKVKSKNGKTRFTYKPHQGFKNKKDFIRRLRLFSWGLKLSLGHLTYDKIREVLAYNSWQNEYYVLPSPQVALSEMKRVIGNGLATLVQNKTSTIFKYKDKLVNYLSSFSEYEDFKSFPIIQGLKNHVSGLNEISKEFSANNIPLKDAITHMIFLDIDSVLSSQRNKILELVTAGKVSKIGLKRLQSEQDVVYGSATAESSFDNANALAINIKSSTQTLLNELENINIKPQPVQTEADYAAAYAKMFGL